MTDAGRHPNIKLLTLAEIEQIGGYVGNFKVRVRQRPRFVREKDCTACGDCAKVCPQATPNEFEIGLATRKAIYSPFAQAVPSAYLVDPATCLGHDPLVCGKCIKACKKQCIDFDMREIVHEFEVGTIVVATGMDVFDPTGMEEYGYGRFPNVVTSLEFERLINAGGPTLGEVERPGDRQVPRSVAFIQCVGSRSTCGTAKPYCSNVCCMVTIKDTLMLKEHYPEMEITVFYLDIRAFGKGFEDLYTRSREAGVRYLRGLPGLIEEDAASGDLVISVENTSTGKLEQHRFDMAVLSVGILPRSDNKHLQEMLALQKTADGFFLEAHSKLMPVDSATRGVFFAGCAEGPKDIKEAVTQASAAAARSIRLMSHGKLKIEALTAQVDQARCTACGICAKVCPYKAIRADAKTKTKATVIEAACAGCGTCSAECPFGAIDMNHYADRQITGQIDAILEESPEREDRDLRLQLVLLRRRRLRRRLAAAVPAERAADPHDVLGARRRELHLARVPPRRAGGARLRLPLRRLPLHRRQPLDEEARREGLEAHGAARHPPGAPAAGVGQRRRGDALAGGHAADGGAAPGGDGRGDRRDGRVLSQPYKGKSPPLPKAPEPAAGRP